MFLLAADYLLPIFPAMNTRTSVSHVLPCSLFIGLRRRILKVRSFYTFLLNMNESSNLGIHPRLYILTFHGFGFATGFLVLSLCSIRVSHPKPRRTREPLRRPQPNRPARLSQTWYLGHWKYFRQDRDVWRPKVMGRSMDVLTRSIGPRTLS